MSIEEPLIKDKKWNNKMKLKKIKITKKKLKKLKIQ